MSSIQLRFKICKNWPDVGQGENGNLVYLVKDNWNDYSFVTAFNVILYDEFRKKHDLGVIRIGFVGQTTEQYTYKILSEQFNELPEDYFSLGDVEYYKKIAGNLSENFRNNFLSALKDIVFDENNLNVALKEDVFKTAFLRGVSLSTVKGQYRRVLAGGSVLTDFQFIYKRSENPQMASVNLSFEVKKESSPSTNIHAIIGRNGIGKTTILNGMIESITSLEQRNYGFYIPNLIGDVEPISRDYFSSLVSVSFSAFDPFNPPREQPNPALGTCYYYIGLKKHGDQDSLKNLSELREEFCDAFMLCCGEAQRKMRWKRAIKTLESDENFARMEFTTLADLPQSERKQAAFNLMMGMSSGHAIVLLTITKLVATVEEKTLVLLDEPESHLHPPLLSAFIRALSELLHYRNGVAVIATHSPVVLQEIPKSCVWTIIRIGLFVNSERPNIQTFGENIGVLTKEVFGLEVVKSGFHTLLKKSVDEGGSFEQIMESYNSQLGFEAQAILRAMIFDRDGGNIQ